MEVSKLRSAEAEESPEAHNRQILFRYAAIIIPLLALGTVLVLTLRPGKGYESIFMLHISEFLKKLWLKEYQRSIQKIFPYCSKKQTLK